MRFCTIASGSSGNCIYVGHNGTHLLVDAGVSAKRIEEGLVSIGVDPRSIGSMLITHDHSDHIQGAAIFSKKFGTDIYATAGTLNCISSGGRLKPANSRLFEVRKQEFFRIGDIEVEPFAVTHDAIDPVGYALCGGGKRLGIATDLGAYNDSIIERLRGSDALYVEANYDVNLLMLGSYPYQLKCRINSPLGHLSNEECAGLIGEVRCEATKVIVLAHISKENNFAELAYETVKQAIESDRRFKSVPELIVAARDIPGKIIEL